jgi:signal recognition particle receptor subunit alpha
MLDSFEILTTSGVVLWSRSYAPTSPAIINSLITNIFIEERTLPGAGIADDISAANNPPYKHDQHTLKWTTVKELGLIFVVSCGNKASSSLLVEPCLIDFVGRLPVITALILD